MSVLEYNVCAAIHNLSLVSKAEEIIRDFLSDGNDIILAINPDGTKLKLQKGVRFLAINGLGIEYND